MYRRILFLGVVLSPFLPGSSAPNVGLRGDGPARDKQSGSTASSLKDGIGAFKLCGDQATKGVFVATFISSEECETYNKNPVLGSPNGYAYSNCSSASFCMTYPEGTSFSGSLQGFKLAAISANYFSDASITFLSVPDCQNALNSTTIYCYTGTKSCLDSQLLISGCSDNDARFALPVSSVAQFNFISND